MERKKTDRLITTAMERAKGIVRAIPLEETHRGKILSLEEAAEEKSLMGLGKVVNSGVREVMACPLVYVALTAMDFEWGSHPSLVLKKGDETVGLEVRDNDEIARLSQRKDVWFMHRNFVVFKERLSFPEDIMKKICHFDIPCIPAEWCVIDDGDFTCKSIIHANPATTTDLFLKEKYFGGQDEKGTGTILTGVAP